MVDAVNGVNNVNNVNNNQTSVLKGTAVATGIGALAGSGVEFFSQKQMFKYGADYFEKQIAEVTKKLAILPKDSIKSKIVQKNIDYLKKSLENPEIKNILKTGKISMKFLAKTAGIGALIIGGIYLAYRGIKALVHKDK